ncbi:MAG TPA: hypothetical protein VFT31_09570 [Kribbella sp.]|nr:hypothetical protein [Kribbella sp.]
MSSAGLERWHVGPWTTRGTMPGEALQPGVRRTPDELNFDVLGLARILGRRLSGREELQVRLWQNELRPTHTRPCGVHTLADPDNARLLAGTAREAFAWLAERAPAGYEFVLTDAVYLRPLTDPSAETVAVEGVLQLAAERQRAVSGPSSTGRVPPGLSARRVPPELPAGRLAASQVRRSAGGWFAGDAICNWSGPYSTATKAVDTVRAARVELIDQLRRAGYNDLADTHPRWPAVPVFS